MTFPHIARVELARDRAEEGADHWRAQGYLVRVYRRALRVVGIAVELHVVVVLATRLPRVKTRKPRLNEGKIT